MRCPRPFRRYIAFLFIIAVSSAGRYAVASETEDLKFIQDRFLSTVTRGHDPCPTTVDPAVREYIFVIEGSTGLDAYKRAYWTRSPRTLKSVRDYFWEGSDPQEEIRSYEEPLSEAPRGWSDEKFQVYRGFFRYIHYRRGTSTLISAVTSSIRELTSSVPKEILYYPWYAWMEAANCAHRLKQLHATAISDVEISSIGFSFGGYASILFARKSNSRGIHLRNVLTLDPVPFTLELYKALRRKDNTTIIPAPNNHDRWVNLYQTEDKAAMETKLGRIPVRGAQVSGRAENQRAEEKGVPVATHMSLPGSGPSRDEISRLLQD